MFFGLPDANHAGPSGNFVKNSCPCPKHTKYHVKSEFGHVHEHQKLQARAKPSRKTCPFLCLFFENQVNLF